MDEQPTDRDLTQPKQNESLHKTHTNERQPNRETSSNEEMLEGNQSSVPLFPSCDIEVHQVIQVSGRRLIRNPIRRPANLSETNLHNNCLGLPPRDFRPLSSSSHLLPTQFHAVPITKKYAAATTRDDAAGKSSKRVSFSSLETVNITRDDTKPDSGKPFKLSEKTRVNLQLQMMEVSKRYEKMKPVKSTWTPMPSKLVEQLGLDNCQKEDAVAKVVPPNAAVLPEQPRTGFLFSDMTLAAETGYDILIDDPSQKDADINYAERYHNLTNVRALCLYQPSNDDDDDHE